MFQPSSKTERRLLRKAARLWGIQADYIGYLGKPIVAKTETLVQLLQSLSGHEIKNAVVLQDLIKIPRTRKLQRMIQPVQAFREKETLCIHGYLPLELKKKNQLEIFCRLEDGKTFTQGLGPVHQVHKLEPLIWQNQEYAQCFFDVPYDFPIGYHKLELRHGDKVLAQSLLICAPHAEKAPVKVKKKWGAFASMQGLRREGGLGIGDLKDMEQIQKALSDLGASFFGTLPLLSLENEGAHPDPSPYSPVSRLFWNEMFLDVESIAQDSPAALSLLRSGAFVSEAQRLQKKDFVDYPAVVALKKPVLHILSEEFFTSKKDESPAYRAYLKKAPLVESYARFRAKGNAIEQRYHMFVQFKMDEALSRLDHKAREGSIAGIYLDFPVGTSRGGYDCYQYASSFMMNMTAGAPPDGMFVSGQSWGFPPLHPVGLRESGYEYFIQCLRHHMHHCSMLRLDHVMAFQRIYVIPEGMDSKSGTYIRYRRDEFFALLAIEAHRAKVEIVGEDLGIVPAAMRTALDENRCRGMWVLPFEAGASPTQAAKKIRPLSLACLNTHDLIPFAGFLKSNDVVHFEKLGFIDHKTALKDEKARQKLIKKWMTDLNLKDEKDLLPALLEIMAASPAEWMLVSMEDLWREEEPLNIPGTWREYPNWTKKLRLSTAQWSSDKSIVSLLQKVNQKRQTP